MLFLQIELDCSLAQVTAFQKLVIPSSQILANINCSKFQKKYLDILYIMLHFQTIWTAQNALKIVRWLCRLSLKISKSKPLCQSWNDLPLPSSERFRFLALNTTFSFTKLFRKYVNEMAECNKISLKFVHRAYILCYKITLYPFPHLVKEQ